MGWASTGLLFVLPGGTRSMRQLPRIPPSSHTGRRQWQQLQRIRRRNNTETNGKGTSKERGQKED
jgi:hypothetical protein